MHCYDDRAPTIISIYFISEIKMAHMNHASTIAVHVDQRHLLPVQFYSLNKIPIDFKIIKLAFSWPLETCFHTAEIKPETDIQRQIFDFF